MAIFADSRTDSGDSSTTGTASRQSVKNRMTAMTIICRNPDSRMSTTPKTLSAMSLTSSIIRSITSPTGVLSMYDTGRRLSFSEMRMRRPAQKNRLTTLWSR